MIKETARKLKKFKPARRIGSKELVVIVFIGIFGVIGSLVLILTHAASFPSGFEPEDGAKSGSYSVTNDSTASGGHAVKFLAGGQLASQFSEDFTDVSAFRARFDYGVSGDLHAGCAIGDCRDNWTGDHDMNCGNPNMTHRTVNFGPGHAGEDSPRSSIDPGFYPCLPADDPAKGHLMTSLNTAGYVIEWFSPKGYFTNVRTVCFDNNMNFQSNGEWFQLVFLTQAEAEHKPTLDGVLINQMDLGYTSPDFKQLPNLPSTIQGTAGAGVKFQLNNPGNGPPDFVVRAWLNGEWGSDGAIGGLATTDKAPRYQICTTDNENGTLTFVNKAPDGLVHTNTMPGMIPNGPIRVVFEHDEYNPDKHNGGPNADAHGEIPANTGAGYTYHWDNITVQ